MAEYEALGHMTKVSENTVVSNSSHYMPHHSGSARSDSGYSINDLQMVRPIIQNDLLSISLRFRQHAFVASADIEKMYRQVLIEPSQRPLQNIIWRSDPKDPLQRYELNTVTYGTAQHALLFSQFVVSLN